MLTTAEAYLYDGGQTVNVLLQRKKAPEEEVLEALEGRRVHPAHELQIFARELERRRLEINVEAW